MHRPDFTSLATPVFRTNPLPTGTGISSIRVSVWHGILQVPERRRFEHLTRLVTPTCRVSHVRIKPARIPGADARRSRALQVDSRIRGKDIPEAIRSRTPS